MQLQLGDVLGVEEMACDHENVPERSLSGDRQSVKAVPAEHKKNIAILLSVLGKVILRPRPQGSLGSSEFLLSRLSFRG